MKEKTRYFYGTIHAERATNEWQRKNAMPARYDTATPAEQAKMREYYNVTDDECEEMRKIYAAFPPHLVVTKSGWQTPDEWMVVAWTKEQDEAVREAIWLLEQLGGAYEGYREKFIEEIHRIEEMSREAYRNNRPRRGDELFEKARFMTNELNNR